MESLAAATTGIHRLPTELLLLILSASAPSGNRRQAYRELSLVHRSWTGSARQLLHRDVVLPTFGAAARLLDVLLQAEPSLARATRRLTISYSANHPSVHSLSTAATGAQAFALLSQMLNLRELTLGCDDGLETALRAVEEAGALEHLEQLTVMGPCAVRWDDFVRLARTTPKLVAVHLTGVHEDKEDEEVDGSDSSGSEPGSPGDADAYPMAGSSHSPGLPTTWSPRYQRVLSSSGTRATFARYLAAHQSAGFPSLAPSPPRDASPPPSRSPSPAPPLLPFLLPLHSLSLTSPTLSEPLLIHLLASLGPTLRSFSLHSASLSRQTLSTLLESLDGLLSLSLTSCTLPYPPRFPVTQDDRSNPLDLLPGACPFLQHLVLGSDSLVSNDILSHLGVLPLASLTLDFAHPRIGPMDLERAFGGMVPGRWESLIIGKRMKWGEEAMARARKACLGNDALLIGEVVPRNVALF